MVARVALALTAVLVLGWTGVLLRNFELGDEAALRAFFVPQLSPAERERDLRRLEDAELLDPSSSWDLARANAHLLGGEPQRAARGAERVLRDEPDNLTAWLVLRRATQRTDPDRSAEAGTEVERLNPLGSGG